MILKEHLARVQQDSASDGKLPNTSHHKAITHDTILKVIETEVIADAIKANEERKLKCYY